MRSFSIILLLVWLSYCTWTNNPDEIKPNQVHCCSLKIEESFEEFCSDIFLREKSRFQTLDTLFIQYESDDICGNRSSEGYKGYRIAFAIYKPDAGNYESEVTFFERIFDKMKPGYLHPLDLTQEAGFAIETWDKNGTYYSTELGPQLEDAKIEIEELKIDLHDQLHPVQSSIKLIFKSTAPLTLWNENKTESIELKITNYSFVIYY